MATGLAVSQMFPLNSVLMIIVDRAGIVVSLTVYKALVSMCAKVICLEVASYMVHFVCMHELNANDIVVNVFYNHHWMHELPAPNGHR